MRVAITGDTHGDLSYWQIHRAKREKVTHLIITGDFGYIWYGDHKENKRLDYIEKNLDMQLLFIDGNHENHPLINNYPVTEMYGGKVHKIRENIIHLIRGEVYEINGDKYFAFGGANSTDIEFRKEGKSWWPEEKPNDDDKLNAYNNLEKHNFKVDYILTHTCYPLALSYVGGDTRVDDVADYLSYIRRIVDFKYWLFGHFHIDYNILDHKTRCMYKDVIHIKDIERSLTQGEINV